jgi:fluoroquinolone transport system permease protein
MMIQTLKLFQIGLRQITKDGMLIVLLPSPFIIGLIFKFAIPFLNGLTETHLSFSLSPWYSLADGLLVCLTPMMTALICAFLLLEERDEGIGEFYQVTPVGDYSYLNARIGIPMIWAFVQLIIVTSLFNLTDLTFGSILTSAVVSTLSSIFLAMMVVSVADNRVEGLALSKIMGISLLGLLTVWVIPYPYQYFASFLPTFWIGKLITEGVSLLSFGFGFLSCFVWIGLFIQKFMRRI